MLGTPFLQRRGRHEAVDRPLPTLPIDVNADSVVGVDAVTDPAIDEFAAPASAIELDGEQSHGPGIESCLDHREDILIPEENITFGWDRVEGVTGPNGDPFQGIRGSSSVCR